LASPGGNTQEKEGKYLAGYSADLASFPHVLEDLRKHWMFGEVLSQLAQRSYVLQATYFLCCHSIISPQAVSTCPLGHQQNPQSTQSFDQTTSNSDLSSKRYGPLVISEFIIAFVSDHDWLPEWGPNM
jgi:hypothetical protein